VLQIRNNNLRWLYNGEQKAKGRPRQYAGKVCLMICHALNWQETWRQRVYTALLFSTDTDCAALTFCAITGQGFRLSFYSAMPSNTPDFAIAKRLPKKAGVPFQCFTGSTESASSGRPAAGPGRRRPQRHFHRHWKTRKFNAHLLERFSCHLALDFTAIKSSPAFATLCNYGAIAA